MKIVVIGGSGLIGSKLTNRLNDLGFDAVPASPSAGVSTVTGEGLNEVLDGARVVVDVSNPSSFDGDAAMEFFETSGRNLLRAEKRAAVKHHIVLTLIGTNRLQESAYFRAKKAQEELVRRSGIPYSIIRSTQLFEAAGILVELAAEGEEIRLAPAMVRPIAADDVCAAMASVAIGSPINGVLEIAGPDVFSLPEFVVRYLAMVDDPRKVKIDGRARYFGALLGNKTFMPDDEPHIGAVNFDTWIKDQLVKI